MKLADFVKLKKFMELTFSTADNEALSAVRMANRILTSNGLTWERVLSRTVNVIAEVEEAPDAHDQGADTDLIEQAARKAERAGGSAFIRSVAEQFAEKGFITDRQRAAVRDYIDGGGRR